MTEDLSYIFFMLWTLTGGFNPLYFKAIITSSYLGLLYLYK